MANFNKVILAGNLTRDPELRYTPKGTAVAEFGVAVNRNWRTESGETREEILFVDIVAYARTAEVIGQYFKKGRPILIDGRLKLDTWEDKQSGQKRSKHRVVLEGFQFIDGGRGDASSGDNPRSRPAAPAAGASPAAAESDGPPPEDDDVPF